MMLSIWSLRSYELGHKFSFKIEHDVRVGTPVHIRGLIIITKILNKTSQDATVRVGTKIKVCPNLSFTRGTRKNSRSLLNIDHRKIETQ